MSYTVQKNPKQIKDINLRPETLKLLEKNLGKTLENIGIGNVFLNKTPVAREIRARIDK
jgi:hypothetical protein